MRSASDSDTRPKAEDATQIAASLASGAVRAAQSPNPFRLSHNPSGLVVIAATLLFAIWS